MKADLYTSEGIQNGSVSLPESIFGIEVNIGLMHEVLQRQMALGRANTATVKTKTEVSGGGRKPWKQKGTGRARQGSIRSAQWRGGGVIFGPTNIRNYEKNMPKKMRRKALFCALSSKATDNSIIALEGFATDIPKTKLFAGLLEKMGCSRRTLVVIPNNDSVLQRSARNLPRVKTILVQYLNIHDIISADRVVFLQESIQKTEEIFGKKS